LARAVAAALACAALSGCLFPAMGPNYKRPVVPLPTNYRIESTEASDVVNTEWWKGFGDENLNELIATALKSNSDILIAAAHIQAFDGRLETTNSHFFPQLGYDVGLERDERSQEVPELLRIGQPITFNQWKYLGTISYEADLWGRVRRSYEAGRAELLSSEQARHTVMLTVVTSVASTYIQLLELDRQLEIAKDTLASFQTSVDLLDKKFHGGSATDIDVAKARADLDDQAAVIPEMEKDIAFLEDQLSTLVGRNPGPIPRGRLDKLTLETIPGGIPTDVLYRRPDVLGAEQDLVAANAKIGIAKTGYFPSLSLTSSFGQSSDQIQWLLAKTARTGVLAIDLIGPIFTFGKVQGEVREARAETKAQTERYQQTIQTALREVDQALVYNQKARERLALLNQHVDELRNVDRLTRLRFQGGKFTDLDVQDADRKLLNSENEQIQGVMDEYSALVAVFKALGGGWMAEQDKKDKKDQQDKKTASNASAAGVSASAPNPTSTTKM
jgi:multidrug efflux system outer membrane protein